MFGAVLKRMINRNWLPAGRQRAGLIALAILVLGAVLAWTLLQPRSGVPDFRENTAGPERKAAFFDFVRPLIEEENAAVRRDRARLLEIAAETDPGWLDRRRVHKLAAEYGLDDEDLDYPEMIETLLRRVDTVPLSLALAQAAKESGWGTSRFARAGNNLFGEWCFIEGCGIVPKSRGKGRRHEVEAFASPRQSVASYLKNINTHSEYRDFRIERARQRATHERLSGLALAESLTPYSERRDEYVEELIDLIQVNDLEPLDNVSSD
jgi:Bax protein